MEKTRLPKKTTFTRRFISIALGLLLATTTFAPGVATPALADSQDATTASPSGSQLAGAQAAQLASQNYTVYYQYSYYVQFNKNSKAATGFMNSQRIYTGDSVALTPNAFKRTGYAFAGWNTKKNGKGKSYKDGQEVKDLAKGGKTVRLYAQWKPANYVTFKANGGKGRMAKQALPTGVSTALYANKFKRAGYAFAGWNTKKNGKGKSYKDGQAVKKLAKAGKTTTLYAQWKNKATVTFKANGGKGKMSAQKLKVGKAAKLAKAKFTRAGYFFKGWSTKKNGTGTAYAANQKVTAPLEGAVKTTLYAQWGKLPTSVDIAKYEQTDYDYNKTYYVTSPQSSSRGLDGTGEATIRFTYNGDEDAYKYVKFSFTDVTPNAYKKMYSDMGVKYSAPRQVSVSKAQQTYSDYMEKTDLSHTAELKVKFGLSTRVFKVTAKAGSSKVTSGYIFVGSAADEKGKLSADTKLYLAVRHKVEQALWKPGMSNRDKLYALAGYINSTTHYPYTASTSPENPLFWNDWSIEGKTLLYSQYDDTLNVTMRFQGGICHCWCVQTLCNIAEEDLGLPYLYNKEKDEVAKGEGVWLGIGDHSSTFTVGNHMSLIYKNANEEMYYIDAQGSDYPSGSDYARCENHKCREYLVSLK